MPLNRAVASRECINVLCGVCIPWAIKSINSKIYISRDVELLYLFIRDNIPSFPILSSIIPIRRVIRITRLTRTSSLCDLDVLISISHITPPMAADIRVIIDNFILVGLEPSTAFQSWIYEVQDVSSLQKELKPKIFSQSLLNIITSLS